MIALEKQINNIEESINKIIDENKELSRKREILMTVPGIGPSNSSIIIGPSS